MNPNSHMPVEVRIDADRGTTANLRFYEKGHYHVPPMPPPAGRRGSPYARAVIVLRYVPGPEVEAVVRAGEVHDRAQPRERDVDGIELAAVAVGLVTWIRGVERGSRA